MEMEVRCLLPTIDPVVLKGEYSEGPISLHERPCDSLSGDHYSSAFSIGEIKQRRDMSTCNNATLANLELPGIDHGECMFPFIHDRPSLFATCYPFTQVARISNGKFNQLPSPVQLVDAETLLQSAAGQKLTLLCKTPQPMQLLGREIAHYPPRYVDRMRT